jgi:hypothetical protein
MEKSENSNDNEKIMYVKYNDDLARAVAKKHQKFLEAVGKL